jgi:hypothetical protein
MTTLTAFLEARLREDQEAAERMAAVYPEPWDLYDRGWMVRVQANEPGWLDVVRLEQKHAPEGLDWLAGAIEHVAMHSPSRVLREVAAKREILRVHADYTRDNPHDCIRRGYLERETWCWVIQQLAAAYSNHEDFRLEWTE